MSGLETISNMTNIGDYNMTTEFFNYSMYNDITNVTNATISIDTNPELRNLIYNILGPTVCAFGMLTNIINLVVLTNNDLPESPYTYLTGLACADFGALILSFIFMMFSKDNYTYLWRIFDAYIFIGLVNVCTTSSIWITVQLTVERFLFIRHPMWAKDTCDRASAKVKILLTIGAAAIFNIPRFLCFEPTFNNKKGWILGSTQFRTSEFFFIMNWLYSACIHFIPLIILTCANIYLVYTVHKAGQQRQKLQIRNNREAAWQREQHRLNVTLISIVFLFIVCIIPSAFSDRPVAYALFNGGKTEQEFIASSFYFSLQYIANFLVWAELSLNFVLYCAFNKKFRRVMKFTAVRCIKKLHVPFCRNKGGPLIHTGQSSTRNSMLNTNSLSIHSKGSLIHHECQPMQRQMYQDHTKDEMANGNTPLMKSRV
ncbi:FMRFamide receptor-like [Mya arenaria]|uniref:FMRFamide receptor-like n=1 Tax=Mya arenaria TaxID=6604 RepID=UPI0022E22872|nr:FMRFamide receptor-like [Mya arenaria]